MKKMILAIGMLAGAAIFSNISQSSAREYPICVQGLYRAGGEGDSIRCEYDTMEQCRAATLGLNGTCQANLLYTGTPVRNAPRSKHSSR